MRTSHLALRIVDLEASLAFYTSVGYKVLGEVPVSEFRSLTMLKLPGNEFVSLELLHDPARSPVGTSGIHHFVVSVDAVHETVGRPSAKGFQADPPSSPDESEHFWTARLTDPGGYRIDLVQWPPGHPGGMTHADLIAPAE